MPRPGHRIAIAVALIFLLAFSSSPRTLDDPGQHPDALAARNAQFFNSLNANFDLSFAEFSAAPLAAFTAVDADRDGTLSVAEQQKAQGQ